jgi:cobaltochelatase CobS
VDTPTKILVNRFSGNKCRVCREPQSRGVQIYWHGKGNGITCTACHAETNNEYSSSTNNSEESAMSESTATASTDYTSMPVDELRKLCRERGLNGTTLLSLGKTQLVEFLTTGSYTPKASTDTASTQVNTNGNGHNSASAIEQAIRQIAESVTTKSAIDEAMVEGMIDSKIKALSVPKPITVTLKTSETGEEKALGVQHRLFPTLLKVCSAYKVGRGHVNVWLAGPAGSGKTTAAQKVAEALELKYYFTGAISEPFSLLGFKNATGEYQRTAFREAYEHGGIFLFDEIDGSSNDAILPFNAATANGHCAFPDGIVERHKDCIIIAAGNTYGLGATADYVGRTKLDAASLDRYVFLSWPVDEALEFAIAKNDSWVRRVQQVRAKAKERGIKVLVTPRASVNGAILLETGMGVSEVEEITLRKGMTDEQWAQVKG